jgi:hypothetical protein
MKALKQPSKGCPDPQRTDEMQNEPEGTAKKRCPLRRAHSASSARYEAFMQELAADFQRLICLGGE